MASRRLVRKGPSLVRFPACVSMPQQKESTHLPASFSMSAQERRSAAKRTVMTLGSSLGTFNSALRLVHPLVLQLLRNLRQLARGAEDGCDLDRIGAAAVDDAVRPDDDLADFGVIQFGATRPDSGKASSRSTTATMRWTTNAAYRGESCAMYPRMASRS